MDSLLVLRSSSAVLFLWIPAGLTSTSVSLLSFSLGRSEAQGTDTSVQWTQIFHFKATVSWLFMMIACFSVVWGNSFYCNKKKEVGQSWWKSKCVFLSPRSSQCRQNGPLEPSFLILPLEGAKVGNFQIQMIVCIMFVRMGVLLGMLTSYSNTFLLNQ